MPTTTIRFQGAQNYGKVVYETLEEYGDNERGTLEAVGDSFDIYGGFSSLKTCKIYFKSGYTVKVTSEYAELSTRYPSDESGWFAYVHLTLSTLATTTVDIYVEPEGTTTDPPLPDDIVPKIDVKVPTVFDALYIRKSDGTLFDVSTLIT